MEFLIKQNYPNLLKTMLNYKCDILFSQYLEGASEDREQIRSGILENLYSVFLKLSVKNQIKYIFLRLKILLLVKKYFDTLFLKKSFLIIFGVKKMDMVSIVVPIYNVENYLTRCLDSILAQDYINYEVLMVNDGSTDNSGRLAQKYTSDSRFKLINQKNAGVSVARNTGIEHANGKYIYFLDPDDWISFNLLSEAIKNIKEKDVDMVFFDFFLANGRNGDFEERWFQGSQGLKTSRATLKALFRNQIGSFAWSFICKSSLYKDKHIRFPVGRSYYEDLGTTYKLIASSDQIYISKSFLYHYFQKNPNSVTKKWQNKYLLDCLKTYDEIEDYLEKYYSTDQVLKQDVYNQKFSSLIMYLGLSKGNKSYYKIWLLIKQLKREKNIRYRKVI